MTNTRLTVQIDGREALPVRAIPFVTGWEFSPGELASDLARRSSVFAYLKTVSAYHLVSGLPSAILPKEWDAIVCDVRALNAELRAQFTDHDLGRRAWRERSPTVLPAGVFVWRDEFENDYCGKLQREWKNLSSYRPGDDDINFTPMLPDTTRTLVFEGFEGLAVDVTPNHPVHRQSGAAPTPDARYTLEEAARVLSDETNERYEQILPRLMSAAESGSLRTYEPGKRLQYTYGPSGSSRVVRGFLEEAYWSDIAAWLKANEPRVEFRAPGFDDNTPRDAPNSDVNGVELVGRPKQQQRWQEDQILQAIGELGYSAHALPRNPPGTSGVKATVRNHLSPLRWTSSVFNKAWERLRAEGRIADSDA